MILQKNNTDWYVLYNEYYSMGLDKNDLVNIVELINKELDISWLIK